MATQTATVDPIDPRKMALQIAGLRANETHLPENERVFQDPYAGRQGASSGLRGRPSRRHRWMLCWHFQQRLRPGELAGG